MGIKRILIISAAVLLLLWGITLLRPYLRGVSEPESGALRAIPLDASVIMRIRGGATFAKDWVESPAVRGLLQDVSLMPAIDSFVQRQARTYRQSGGRAVEYYISIHAPKGLPIQWLCVMDVGKGIDDADGLREFLLGREAKIFSERIYEGVKVRAARVVVGEREKEFYYGVAHGVGLLCTSSSLVESAIRTLTSDYSLARNDQFLGLLRMGAGSAGVEVYVQPPYFLEALGNGLKTPWRGSVKSLGKWAQWLSLDLRVGGNIMTASGVSHLSDTIRRGADVLRGAVPMRMLSLSVLPAQCDFFLRWADARAGDALGRLPYADLQKASGYTDQNRKRDMQLLRSVGSGEIVLAHLPFQELPERDRWAVFVSCQSPSLAVQKLSSAICQLASPLRRKIDHATNLEVYRTVRSEYFSHLLSPFFGDSVAAYFMAAEETIIFSSSMLTLERIAIANLRRQTLQNDEYFGEFMEQLKGESNFTFYLSPDRQGAGALSSILNVMGNSSRWGWLSQLQRGALQLTAGRDIVFYNLAALQGDSDLSSCSMRVEWATRLDAPVALRPIIMKSHVSEGKEVMVQDTLGNLYLVSSVGGILWKKPLQEAILGEPQQVDIYRNGKLQYAFATRRAIWVVDRNGNNVDGFPIVMPEEVTAPLGVFDYDGDRQYRFMVCMADCSARVYNASGSMLADFSPAKFDMPIVQQPIHVRTAGKDFIVVSDARRLYLLSRRGEERLVTSEPVARHSNASLVLLKGSSELVTVDEAGSLCRVSMQSGKVSRVTLAGDGELRGAVVLESAKVGEASVVVARGKMLYFYDLAGRRLSSRKFDGGVAPDMYIFQFALHDWRVGVRELGESRLWLLDMRGGVMDGFPIPGNTGFTIGHLEGNAARFNLITGGSPSLLETYTLPG